MIIPSRRRFLLGDVGFLAAPAIVQVASLMPVSASTPRGLHPGWYAAKGDVFAPCFNVIDYGADPTGMLDSTAAIGRAIEAAGRQAGTVFFPAGTYNHTSPMFDGRVNMVGAGADQVTVRFR